VVLKGVEKALGGSLRVDTVFLERLQKGRALVEEHLYGILFISETALPLQ
jgi:hypothetical protein